MSHLRPHRPSSWQIYFLILDNRTSEGGPPSSIGITLFMTQNSSYPWDFPRCIGKSPHRDYKMPLAEALECFASSDIVVSSSTCASSLVRGLFPASSSCCYQFNRTLLALRLVHRPRNILPAHVSGATSVQSCQSDMILLQNRSDDSQNSLSGPTEPFPGYEGLPATSPGSPHLLTTTARRIVLVRTVHLRCADQLATARRHACL